MPLVWLILSLGNFGSALPDFGWRVAVVELRKYAAAGAVAARRRANRIANDGERRALCLMNPNEKRLGKVATSRLRILEIGGAGALRWVEDESWG